MIRRKKHDAQVDPFTAGEPTLPWGEPGTFEELFNGAESETCAFDGGSYDGPTKTRDDYEAPSADDAADNTWREQQPRTFEVRERKRKKRAQRTDALRASRTAPRDKRGPSRLGKAVRAVLISVILVNLMPVLIYGIADLFSDLIPDPDSAQNIGHQAASYDGHDPSPGIDMDSLDEDELTCVQICDAYLQAVTGEQSPERTAIIDDLDQSMMEATGYTCEELGIDANVYADWELSNFSYQIDSCYAHADEGTASLYLYAWGPDLLDMRATLRRDIYTYITELGAGEARSMRPLTESEQEHVRELLTKATESAELGSESFLGFQLTFENDTWVLDLEQAQHQLGMPLGY